MKKLVSLIVAILAMVAILFGVKNMLQAKETSGEQQQVFLFNWGNYIDPELIKEFEAETGIQVVYETFDSNDAMEAKLKQGGTRYDIVFPSESSITKLVNQNLLQKLDHSKIKGLENISPFLLNSPVDNGNQYTIPYFWGTVGIMVNTKYIDPESIQTWSDLWKEDFKNKVLVLDGNREALGMALQSLGYSLNSKNENELHAAEVKLKELKPNVRAVLNEEIKTMMKLEEAPIGMLQLLKKIQMYNISCQKMVVRFGQITLRLHIRLSMSKVRMPLLTLCFDQKMQLEMPNTWVTQHQTKKQKS